MAASGQYLDSARTGQTGLRAQAVKLLLGHRDTQARVSCFPYAVNPAPWSDLAPTLYAFPMSTRAWISC